MQPIFPVCCSVHVFDVLKADAHAGFNSGYTCLVSQHVAGRALLETAAHDGKQGSTTSQWQRSVLAEQFDIQQQGIWYSVGPRWRQEELFAEVPDYLSSIISVASEEGVQLQGHSLTKP